MSDPRASGGPESGPPGFPELGLKSALLETLKSLGHATPTPIQIKTIPLALARRDVLGCAQTGTGKTAAFCLPMLQRFDDGRGRVAGRVRALVLAPTRELAAQIGKSMADYGAGCAVSHTVVFGGVGQSAQARDLRRGVDVLVATPGRLEDLLKQGLADLSQVEVLVIDEVDRMLDQGFLPAVRRIARRVPVKRQTLMFSATMPRELRALACELLSSPAEVAVDYVASTPDSIEQSVFLVDAQRKRLVLERLVSQRDLTRALVFTRTKHGADRVARHLRGVEMDAEAIHGGKSQASRERTLAAFRDGGLRILVATDLAARGIHVDDISHVINFDLPDDPENYVHRIGRTARAGARGQALSLCSPDERDRLRRIERLIQRSIEPKSEPKSESMLASAAPAPRSATQPRPEHPRTMARDAAPRQSDQAPRAWAHLPLNKSRPIAGSARRDGKPRKWRDPVSQRDRQN